MCRTHEDCKLLPINLYKKIPLSYIHLKDKSLFNDENIICFISWHIILFFRTCDYMYIYIYVHVYIDLTNILIFTARDNYPEATYLTAQNTDSTLVPPLFSSHGSNAYLGNQDYIWIIRAVERRKIITLEVCFTLQKMFQSNAFYLVKILVQSLPCINLVIFEIQIKI